MERRFQQFVFLTIVVTVMVELLGWFYLPTDPVLADFRRSDGFAAIVGPSFVLYGIVITIRFTLLVGLLQFQRGARFAFLIFTVVSIIASSLWGYRVSAPIESPILLLETLLDGVILAIAYYSTAASRFRRQTTE